MTCEEHAKKANSTSSQQGAVLPIDLQQLIDQKVASFQIQNPEQALPQNKLLNYIQKLREEYPHDTTVRVKHILEYADQLEIDDSTFQAIAQAFTEKPPSDMGREVEHPAFYFLFAGRVAQKMPRTFDDLYRPESIRNTLDYDFDFQDFCDTALAFRQDTRIKNKLVEDLADVATQKPHLRWANLFSVYPVYWLKNPNREENLAQMLTFLGPVAQEITNAEKQLKVVQTPEEQTLAHHKIFVYSSFVQFVASLAAPEDQEFISYFQGHLAGRKISPAARELFKHAVAVIKTPLEQRRSSYWG